MNKLSEYVSSLEKYIDFIHLKNHSVSKSTIGWQIDHILIVINGIIGQLKNSDAANYKAKFNIKRFIVYTTNHIPRGKATAPKIVNPENEAAAIELFDKIALAKTNLLEIDTFDKNNFFKHPFFGDLNVKQTKKFLALHTFHHLKIIQDIAKNQ